MSVFSERPFMSDLSPLPHLRLIPGRVTAGPGQESPGHHRDRSRAERRGAGPAEATGRQHSMAAYHGLAAWIDIYDAGPGSGRSGPSGAWHAGVWGRCSCRPPITGNGIRCIGNLRAHLTLLERRSSRDLHRAWTSLVEASSSAGPALDWSLVHACTRLALLRLACIHEREELVHADTGWET